MIATPALEFVLAGPDGHQRTLIVDAERARVGSGASCELRLGAEDAAAEQLRFEVRGEHVFAEPCAAAPPVWLDGAPFAAGRVDPGARLAVGRVTVQVRVIERHAARSPAGGRGLLRLCAALGGVAIPLGILLAGPRSEADDWAWRASPALWPTVSLGTCPSQPGSPSALGDELRRQGELARERAPFSPGDAVAAVELLGRSAACYAAAGASRHADRVRSAAERLRVEIERQYHVHQVRLERALVARDRGRVRSETQLLLAFSAGRPSEYADWLATLERQMDVRLSGAQP